jgi:hypothetical protein
MIDVNTLGNKAVKSHAVVRAVVAGRVLQADVDFHCYECARVNETLKENQTALLKVITAKRKLAGAETVNAHITTGLKGGREQMATVKPYQISRAKGRDPEVQVRVKELRTFLSSLVSDTINVVASSLQEADDAMCQYQGHAIDKHGLQSSVIMSNDKDLWMVQGLHCNSETGEIHEVDGYGYTAYKEVGNVKPKLVGRGTSWFWHQMLIGDGADSIPGLEMLTGKLANVYLPLKKYNRDRADLKCGEAKAVAILKDVHSDKMAALRVFECYYGYYGRRATERMVEQGFLLWMRRTNKLSDVLSYFRECGLDADFTATQKMALREYLQIARDAVKVSET